MPWPPSSSDSSRIEHRKGRHISHLPSPLPYPVLSFGHHSLDNSDGVKFSKTTDNNSRVLIACHLPPLYVAIQLRGPKDVPCVRRGGRTAAAPAVR